MSQQAKAPQPLKDVVVLDFSTLLPGPLATLMLAEAGAQIIKIERPEGDDMRHFPPVHGDSSAPYTVLNRGKEIVRIDLKSPEALATLRPMIERADILVEQFRPGVMDRLGLGYDQVRAINQRLVYCSITGYGQAGPRAAEAGHDLNYQSVTGLLSLSPLMPAALVADIAGGAMPAVMNILLALRQRDQTGQGTHLDIAMADAMFTFAWYGLAESHATGRFPGPGENMLTGGSPRYGLYPTADGRMLAVGALEQKFWDRLCEAIALPGPLRQDHFDPAATRTALARIIGERTADDWARLLGPLDCCCTIVASLEEALADPHFRERGLFGWTARGEDGSKLPATVMPIAPQFRAPDED